MQPSKCRGRISGHAVERRREMAGAAKPRARSDLVNGQLRFAEKQTLRTGDALPHNIRVGRHTDGLAKRALEMPNARPGELAELAQRDGLRKILFHVVQDQLQAAPREAVRSPWAGRREC